MSYKDEGDAGFHLQGLQFHPHRLPQFQIERGQRIVQQLPNAAEVAVAEVIRRHGHPGFEAALLAFLGRAVAPDNLLVLAHRAAAPPLVLFRQAAEAQLFAALAEAQWAGLPASDNVPEAGPVTRLVVALQRARPPE